MKCCSVQRNGKRSIPPTALNQIQRQLFL